MPRDSRLYMTFPIDFWTHPKVSRLTDSAFRAFVEANGHSRMRETDGVLEVDDAEFLWSTEALAELERSHPTRPLVTRSADGNYFLRDYAEHQFTKADRDALSEKRSRAGRASADKRRTSVEHVLSKTEHTSTESESRSESGTGITTHLSDSQSLDTASVSTDSEEVSAMTRRLAAQAGVANLSAVVEQVAKHTGRAITHDAAYRLSVHLIGKAKSYPKNPQAYVTRSISLSSFEVQQFIDEAVA